MIRTLGVMALLLCLQLQGAVLPQLSPPPAQVDMSARMDMSACEHHRSTPHNSGHHGSHSQCCKGVGCGCAQLAAPMASLPSLVSFVPVTKSTSIRSLLSLACPSAKFFRPPI